MPFTRGPLAYLLRNRFYIGQVVFKGETLPGEQPAIVAQKLFDAVQAKLNAQVNNHKAARANSEALLLGRIYDDRGHRMTPSHARRRGIKYRYYISSALLQGRPKQAGTISRIPANEIESLVGKSVRDRIKEAAETENAILIHNHAKGTNTIAVPWRKAPSKRRREILVSDSGSSSDHRPIRSESRALLVASIAQGRRWLADSSQMPMQTPRASAREGCSTRKVNMTISLAFVAPNLVKAAIDGRLPHGMGVARLCDLPAEWSRQRQTLGLNAI